MSKKIIVTTSWDDNSYENLKMIRLLDKFGLLGTFYINSRTDSMGRNLNEARIKEMVFEVANSRHEIGSHTMKHENLTECQNPSETIVKSKYELEKLTKRDVIAFCYPNGAYNNNISDIVKDAGYLCARTCEYMGNGLPKDPYKWGITLHASNGSPLTILKTWWKSRISSKSLLDWEIRARLLFDMVLEKGGIWHLWGHSWEIQLNNDWDKLSRVFEYVSNREGVLYVENGKIFKDN